MIVDPDFCDHWKTRLLVGELGGDECGPVYVLRLWSHCQNRRKSEFDSLSPNALKALCHFPGNAIQLETSLVTSGFIRRNGVALIVCGWADYNAQLLAAWDNGRKGGRPRRTMTCDDDKTQEKPTGSRTERNGTERNGMDTVRPFGTDHLQSWPEARRRAKDAAASLWPSGRPAPKTKADKDRMAKDNVMLVKVAFLSIALFSDGWLADAIGGATKTAGIKKPIAYLKKILGSTARDAGHDLNRLLDSLVIPPREPEQPEPALIPAGFGDLPT